jgi:transcriptional regulator
MNKTEQLLNDISSKLNAVLLVLLSSDFKTKTMGQKVGLLAQTGMSNQDIANILGTTRGSVEVLKSLGKNKKTRG